jgi:AcrR family transcriptional regulator
MLIQKDQNRQKIIAAAGEPFYHFGVAKTNMDDVAKKAGVTKRTVYQHFQNKEFLVEVVMAETSKNISDKLDQKLKAKNTSTELLIDFVKRAFEKCDEDQGLPTEEIKKMQYETAIRYFYPYLQKVIERGVKDKEFKSREPRMHAELIWQLIGTVFHLTSCPEKSTVKNLTHYKKFLLSEIPRILKSELKLK